MRLIDLAGKNVVMWGAGRECQALQEAITRLQLEVRLTIVDENVAPLDPRQLQTADVVVKSPGVSRYHPLVEELRQLGTLTTATNLWFAEPHRHVIGVTGTKGKSTTSSLIAHLLTVLGFSAQLAGNIGRSPLSFLGLDEPQWWVLELSSFQTSDLLHSPDIGVLTSVSPEHLDWHGSFEYYVDDKLNLFAHNPNIISVVNTADAGVCSVLPRLPNVARPVVTIEGGWFHFDGKLLASVDVLQLAGPHNIDLACVALTVLHFAGVNLHARATEIRQALSTFEALPHRLQLVGEVAGVEYINDSLATTPLATMAALKAFTGRPITVLVGGHDRGLSYDDFAIFVAAEHRDAHIVTMPDNGIRFAEVLHTAGFPADHIHAAESLAQAVQLAAVLTPENGVVLLSPAAPSFGQFRDYAERGLAFATEVQNVNAAAVLTPLRLV